MKHNSKVESEKEMSTQFLCGDEKEKSIIPPDDTGNDGGKPRPDPETKGSQEPEDEDEIK